MKARRAAGFTLVEALVAAMILFLVLTSGTLAYQAAVSASLRAEGVARLLAPAPLIRLTVRERLQANPEERLAGEGELLGVAWRFEARSVRFAPPPPRFDGELRDIRQFPPRFRLYDVELTLARAGRREVFLYQELAWLPLVE